MALCPACGHNNPETNVNCERCGANLSSRPGEQLPPQYPNYGSSPYGAPPPQQPDYSHYGQAPVYGPPADAPNPTTYLALSIAMTMCCCMPAGVVGIIFSALAMGANSSGDYKKAADQVRIARISLIAGLILGGLFSLFYLILVVFAEAANSGGF